MTTTVTVPYNGWMPRKHQEKLWQYLEDGGKRAMAIWHRRAGKDEVSMHFAAVAAAERVCNLWHLLPEYEQARKAIWTAVNPHTGIRRIDEVFPLAWRESTNETSMFIRFKNQSTWACVGSDNAGERLVGSSCAGVVFSEYALSNPSAWGYLRPMIEENNGFAVFITTPRGYNHAKTMYDYAMTQKDWFAQLLTAEDTGALTKLELDDALAEYQSIYGLDQGRSAFLQEYYCSFAAGTIGAFYAAEMHDVRRDGRIMEFEALDDRPVYRAWDLGVKDDTSIWFYQVAGGQVRLLDFYSASGVGLEHYAEQIAIREKKYGWISGDDYVPHDAKVRELGSGRTRVETMRSLGLSPLLVRAASFNDGVNAVRRTLPLSVFHPRCEARGIPALEQYRREYDDEKKCFRASPLHDWCSDPADAFRYLSMAWRPQPRLVAPQPQYSGLVIPPVPDSSLRRRAMERL